MTRRVLIVDDDDGIREVAKMSLELVAGWEVVTAPSGTEGLAQARAVRPDGILLDVMMPGLDGFEVCRRVKASPETRDTVVIFLSARGEVSDKVSGLELGAIDYITKPIQAEEVLARVSVHLSRLHLERALRQSRDRLDKELAGAARMQRLLLPIEVPAHPHVQFGTYYQTSRHAGGDYYDLLPLGDDRFGILVVDVSGHGAPAAIVMAMIRAVVHAYPGRADDPPALLHYINRHFAFLWDTPMYATALYAVLDARRRTLRLSSAGHPMPLLRRDAGTRTLPGDNAMCVLWNELGDVPCTEHALEAGDVIAFFTDGITDRQAAGGAMFDLDRLCHALDRAGSGPPAGIVAAVIAELDAFAGGQEPDDDQTLLVIGLE